MRSRRIAGGALALVAATLGLAPRAASGEEPKSFSEVSFGIFEVDGAAAKRRVAVSASANVTVRRWNGATTFPSLEGVATREELEALAGAIARADVATLGSSTSGGGGRAFFVLETSVPGEGGTRASGSFPFAPELAARLSPLLEVLEAIERRLDDGPFTRLVLELSNAKRHSATRLTLEPDGAARLECTACLHPKVTLISSTDVSRPFVERDHVAGAALRPVAGMRWTLPP